PAQRQGQSHDLRVCLCHLIRYHVTIQVHRGTDITMAHKLLLHSDWSSYRIQPRTVAVAKGVSRQFSDSRSFCRFMEHSQYLRIRPWQSSKLGRRSKQPISIGGKL